MHRKYRSRRISKIYARILTGITLCFFYPAGYTTAQEVQLKDAVTVISRSVPSPMYETVGKMLREEIGKRTGLQINRADRWPVKNAPVIAIALASDAVLDGVPVPVLADKQSAMYKPEGFRVVTQAAGQRNITWIIGADSRGVLFGAGWLLRNLQMGSKTLKLSSPADVVSSPVYPIRGHQLGYRTTANSYDAWTPAQFEQYIRDLAIFGTNAVEGIPFHEDEIPSPHFTISSAEMRVKMSEICQAYDMDYWVWTPATFDLTDKTKRQAELDWHESLYKSCPRLDHIFFPGGDPGDNHPSEVMPFLKDLYDRLVKYHPNAKMWISLQGFSEEQVDYFYQYLDKYQPRWLEGVVSGPGSPPTAQTRYRLPAKYKHRQYPDITHSVRCEFPVPNWDQAYALTLGRESVNPRPAGFYKIQQTYAPFTDGFVSYSDGVHDDVNKIVWSMGGWDPQKPVTEVMEEYARFFFGTGLEKNVEAGIAALEQNWNGPLADNGGVEAALSFWTLLEKQHPRLSANWRWQMLLLRAYYDAYTRRRLIYEQGLEKKANEILAAATPDQLVQAMDNALGVLNQADKQPVSPDLRKKITELCEALYQSIGLQTSVPKYKASGYERGAVLDFADYPLNNRWWLEDEFKKIRTMTDKGAAYARIQQISHWENPGPGSYYDDISSVSKDPRVATTSYDATDIAWWDNGMSRQRLSFQTFQRCPLLHYTNLDPAGRYKIRVVGSGDALLRVDDQRLSPVIYNKDGEGFKEWIVPFQATGDGKITVSFDEPEESDLNWRKQSKIYDIWLIKEN